MLQLLPNFMLLLLIGWFSHGFLHAAPIQIKQNKQNENNSKQKNEESKSQDTNDLPAFAKWSVGKSGKRVERNGYYRIAISPDGRFIAGRTQKNEVKIFDYLTQEQLCTVVEEGAYIQSVDFSLDGEFFLTAIAGEPVRVYKTESGELFKELGKDLSLAYFSPDGKWIVATGKERIKKFAWPGGKMELGKKWRLAANQSVKALSKDGNIVLSCSTGRHKNSAKVIRADRKNVIELRGVEGSFKTAQISPDGHWVAATFFNSEMVFLWNLQQTRSPRYTLDGHIQSVQSFAFSPDSRLLISTSWDRSAILWELASKKQLASIEGHQSNVNSSQFHPFLYEAATGASGNRDSRMILWDIESILFPERQLPKAFESFEITWKEMGSELPEQSYKATQAFMRFESKWIGMVRTKLLSEQQPSNQDAIVELVLKLGSPKFEVRQDAMSRLMVLRAKAEKILKASMSDPRVNAEARHRIFKLLKEPVRIPRLPTHEMRRIQKCLLALEISSSQESSLLLKDLTEYPHYTVAQSAASALERKKTRQLQRR